MNPAAARLALTAILLWPAFAVAQDSFEIAVAPVLKSYCISCHGGNKPKGDLALDRLAPDFEQQSAVWQGVMERISDGSMPPKGKPRPSGKEQEAAGRWLRTALTSEQAKKAATVGRTRLRRLNRVEYVNTIRDLLGVEVDIETLPEDGIASGFDNVDTALDLSATLLERYLEAADTAVVAALAPGAKPVAAKRHIDMVPLAKQITKTIRPMPRFGVSTRIQDSEVLFLGQNEASKPLLDTKAPTTGLYRFRIAARAVRHEPVMTLIVYAGNYGRGVQGLMTRPLGMVDVAGAASAVEFSERLAGGESIRLMPYGMPNAYKTLPDDYAGPGLAMQWIEVEGPLVDVWPPAATTQLLGEVDLTRGTLADAEAILRRFAPRAFRRPVSAADLAPFLNLVKTRLDKGYAFAAALRVGLTGVLCSPDFLYLSGTPGKLNDFDLASRLAYFLWSAAPDAPLAELAAKGELGQSPILRQQVERMLADPRAHAFTENFTGQWLSLRNLKATIPDKKLYPDFDDFLELSMPRETHLFFEEVLQHDRSVLEFVHADWSMLNSRLASLYGIKGIDGSSFRKVQLPPGSHRGGVMTQSAVLRVTANGTNTSPVTRGTWVLDRILGTPAPPPPRDVPAIEPDIRGAKTLREQLAKHRQIESCANCHAKIDPAGNALENFDVIGGWRDFYRTVPGTGQGRVQVQVGRGKLAPVGKGPSVHAADELPGARKFANVDEFKQLILADPTSFTRGLTQRLLVYATGHAIELADRAVVDQIVAELPAQGHGFRSLMHAVVQSPTFRSK